MKRMMFQLSGVYDILIMEWELVAVQGKLR